MTTVYLVRHAEPNYDNHDDMSRELSVKGLHDRTLVSTFLQNKHINAVYSSPFKRAIDTVKDFADKNGFNITIIDNFKERKVDSIWIEDFESFSRKQWDDFNYKLSDGECLKEVQERNINELTKILENNNGKNIVIGSHGTAISTIINYYDDSFDYSSFAKIRFLMPWIVKLSFNEKVLISIDSYNLFEQS